MNRRQPHRANGRPRTMMPCERPRGSSDDDVNPPESGGLGVPAMWAGVHRVTAAWLEHPGGIVRREEPTTRARTACRRTADGLCNVWTMVKWRCPLTLFSWAAARCSCSSRSAMCWAVVSLPLAHSAPALGIGLCSLITGLCGVSFLFLLTKIGRVRPASCHLCHRLLQRGVDIPLSPAKIGCFQRVQRNATAKRHGNHRGCRDACRHHGPADGHRRFPARVFRSRFALFPAPGPGSDDDDAVSSAQLRGGGSHHPVPLWDSTVSWRWRVW